MFIFSRPTESTMSPLENLFQIAQREEQNPAKTIISVTSSTSSTSVQSSSARSSSTGGRRKGFRKVAKGTLATRRPSNRPVGPPNGTVGPSSRPVGPSSRPVGPSSRPIGPSLRPSPRAIDILNSKVGYISYGLKIFVSNILQNFSTFFKITFFSFFFGDSDQRKPKVFRFFVDMEKK